MVEQVQIRRKKGKQNGLHKLRHKCKEGCTPFLHQPALATFIGKRCEVKCRILTSDFFSSGSLLSAVNNTRRWRFVQLYFAEIIQEWFDVIPDPDGDVFRRWVFQSFNVVNEFVIQLVNQRIDNVFQFFKIHDPSKVRVTLAFYKHAELVGMSVYVLALVSFGHVRQKMRGVEGEILVNFHQAANVRCCKKRGGRATEFSQNSLREKEAMALRSS